MTLTPIAVENETLRRFTIWRMAGYSPYRNPVLDKVRAFGVALVLKVALRLGFVVVLLGRCRSGKTYLLQQFLTGKIIDRSSELRMSGKRPLFGISDVPANGHFAIDEIATFEPRSMFDGVLALAQCGRRFALAAQCVQTLDEANIGRALMGRRVLVISLEYPKR